MRHEIVTPTSRGPSNWRRVIGRPMRVAITGEARVLDRAWLGKLGNVEEMKAEALFGYGPFPAAGPQARADK